MWVMKWSELLQVRSNKLVSYKATLGYYNWLKDQLAANVPIDQWVRELLTASGSTMSSHLPIFITLKLTPENCRERRPSFSWDACSMCPMSQPPL